MLPSALASTLAWAPVPVVDALVIVTAALACGMALTTRLTKRLGVTASLLAGLAVLTRPSWLLLCLAVLVLLLWLLGRGIPGRRPRPAWLRIEAVVTGVTAIAAVVALLS